MSRISKKNGGIDRNKLASAIYSAAQESLGINDREILEELISQIMHRFEGCKPLPGMEGLLNSSSGRAANIPGEAELLSLMKEILTGNKKQQDALQNTALEKPNEKREPPPDKNKTEQISSEIQARPPSTPRSGFSTTLSLTPNSLKVLEKRYLRKDRDGNVIETPEDMFRRVAKYVAAAELLYTPLANINVKAREEEFYNMMIKLEFLPNSPTLMNAGRELGQLSACFVLPIEDSMESIFETVKYTALIHKSGGGTGFSFSRLRPEKDKVGSTGGVASGPVSFMRVFDTATEVIKQGGMRRGANMGILSVDHPDIMAFITAKQDSRELNNFNISVAVTSEFMEAVKQGKEYDLRNPRDGEISGKLKAQGVFDKTVEMAWKTGDPGIIFIDRINRDNPTPKLGKIESTNPCGEQPLLPYESCNLGSINLSKMVSLQNGKGEIAYDRLARTVKLAVHFLDNVIDVNKFPLPQIEKQTRALRKIGLGIMGFSDMLVDLGVPYDSPEALTIGEKIMQFIDQNALDASMELAQQRGEFPAFKDSIYASMGLRVRNATRTTIAPTGTLSIISACSSGIEPLFALAYTRNILDGEKLIEVNPRFEETAKKEGFYSKDLIEQLAGGASLKDLKEVPDRIKRLFVTAHDISPEYHVLMQSAFQKHTNNAVSKTVNFPHDATLEDVAKVYMLAYQEGLKGITIYRDRSRENQVLSTSSSIPDTTSTATSTFEPRKRPKVTRGVTEKATTSCGTIYVTVNSDEKGLCEVFSSLGKAGGCASAQLEAISRLISLALRSGVSPDSVVKQLRGIRCPSIAWEEGHAILSCADAIGGVLEKYVTGSEEQAAREKTGGVISKVQNLVGQCPECGSVLVYQEGCHICNSCGFTRCG